MSVKLFQGDCRELLRSWPDSWFDSVVTDPPYGLSKEPDVREVLRCWLADEDYTGSLRKGKEHCLAHIGRRSCIRNADYPDSSSSEKGISFYVSCLLTSEGVKNPVKLNNQESVREKEVDDKRSRRPLKHVLVNERDSSPRESLRGKDLCLRVRKGFTPCVGICSCFTKAGPSIFRIHVRLRDDTFAQAQGSSNVVTASATERVAVLTLNVTRQTGKLSPADPAVCADSVPFELFCSQPIRAISGAGSFPAPGKTSRAGRVTTATNRARSLNLMVQEDLVDRLLRPSLTQFGFMNKSWDSFVPGPSFWQEVYRVLKPGAYLLAFAGTRTFDLMSLAIRLAGFENRDTIASMSTEEAGILAWTYGVGFPKSLNLPGGLGTALKPAFEPVLVFRKPLADSVSRNLRDYGTGVLNIGGCRTAGNRWPANLLLTHHPDCTPVHKRVTRSLFNASEGYETEDSATWLCAAGCPVKAMGEANRFFYQTKVSTREREFGCAHIPLKTAGELTGGRAEGSDGLRSPRAGAGRTSGGRHNQHPTVKPLRLLTWLVRLVTPTGGKVLDPFAGSGTTGMAAVIEGCDFVGIELEREYFPLTCARVFATLRGKLLGTLPTEFTK